jgi:hypothetical protein
MRKLFLVILVITAINARSQKVTNDENYYERFPKKLTGRIYLAQKFLKYTIPSDAAEDIEYKANTKMNLGIGVTYKNISFNVFYGFAFLNKDTAKGTTKGLDLQLHLYPRRWAIDVLALFPKGYYLAPKGFANVPTNTYYHRPDIQVKLAGVSAYKVPNKQKFSYRAAITQCEWQKKSAGSLLYGGLAYYGLIKGDSALVPKAIQNKYMQQGLDNINFMAIGGGIGYAFTLVAHQHFFLTASAVGNLDLALTSEEGPNGKQRNTTAAPSIVAKASVGYNSRTWSVSLNSLGSAFWNKGSASPQKYYLPTGVIRLAVSRKFDVEKKKK